MSTTNPKEVQEHEPVSYTHLDVYKRQVKDTFEMERREKILALIQVLFVIGPIVAPMAGTAVLAVADWRGTFWVLTVVGVACLALSLLFSETLDGKDRYRDSLASTLGRLVVVARDPGFFVFLVVSSIFEIPYMAVSYTHLDVYKRQASFRTWGSLCTLLAARP